MRKLRKQYVAALDEHVEGSKVIRENVKARAKDQDQQLEAWKTVLTDLSGVEK